MKWFYRPDGKYDDWGTVKDEQGYIVAEVKDPMVTTYHLNNHRRDKTDPYRKYGILVSKAPEMLEAINELLDNDGSRGTYRCIHCYDAHAKLEKIINEINEVEL